MKRRAFTLIELLVVVAIILTLAGITISLIGTIRRQVWDLDTTRRIAAVEEAIQQYQAGDNQAYLVHRWGLGEDFRWGSIRQVFETLRDQWGYDLTTVAQSDSATKRRPDNVCLDYSGTVTNYALDERVRWGERSDTTTYDWVTFSKIGETLDRTYEVLPVAQWGSAVALADYGVRWPKLVETGTAVPFTQSCWPVSDWDQATPGTVPVKWHWPWGERIHARLTGAQVEQRESHNLGQLSPLATINLLIMAGILPNDGTGAEQYRSDRSPKQKWNDRWGNPLTIAYSIFLPPRYDFQDSGSKPYPELSDKLLGGRDLFLRKSKDAYGFSRAVYLVVGAIGAKARTVPTSWTAADDAVVLRDNWLQIREVCKASEWDETGFRKAPWQGVRVEKGGTAGDERCYLSTPMLIK